MHGMCVCGTWDPRMSRATNAVSRPRSPFAAIRITCPCARRYSIPSAQAPRRHGLSTKRKVRVNADGTDSLETVTAVDVAVPSLESLPYVAVSRVGFAFLSRRSIQQHSRACLLLHPHLCVSVFLFLSHGQRRFYCQAASRAR